MAKNKKKSKSGLVIGIVVAVVIVGLIVIPMITNKANLYTEQTVKKDSINTYYTFSGNVESKNTQNVMAEKIMQISDIKIKEGNKVAKDDILFKTSQGDEIKAKVAGTISKINVDEDESVMAGAKLCDIIDFDNLKVTVKVDEYDLSSIEKDKEVSVTIGAINKEITGKVSSVSDTAINENGVAYFTATLDLTVEKDIKVGMSAEAKILNKSANNVLTVSMKTLQFDENDKPYVYIKGDKEIPTKRAVKIGINDGKTIEIVEGLTEGQTIMYLKSTSSSDNSGRGGVVPPMPGR
ncbi:efflux RND transporter periplasmic adaptor subunit [Clostridium sp.]|uniref:efflux RND transporter periplasmic adaptor subunit n=1 Tax=Clostridium sp. TaxID=1506 RepID=UPI003D6C978F